MLRYMIIMLIMITLCVGCSSNTDTDTLYKQLTLLANMHSTYYTEEELDEYFTKNVIKDFKQAQMPKRKSEEDYLYVDLLDKELYQIEIVDINLPDIVLSVDGIMYIYTIEYKDNKISNYERAPYIRSETYND